MAAASSSHPPDGTPPRTDASPTPTEVSVVLPAYEEADTLERTVATTLETLDSFLPEGTFEVIVAEDGCTDRTPEIAASLANEDPRVRHVHSDGRLGRGRALERAFRAARGQTLAYLDTDLATDMRHLGELVESVRSGGYDVATGSRWMPGRTADRPLRRDVASRGYNALVRLALRSDVRDHQCGFKAFDRAALLDLLDDVEDGHWFWDTEVLVRAQRRGYRVKEFAVSWEPKGDSTVDLTRDVAGMGAQVARTWWQLDVSPRLTTRTTVAVGALLSIAALALMTVYLDPAAVLATLGRVDPALVAAATLVYVASWPVRGLRYRDILAELGHHERAGFLTGAVLISQTGNLVFPARAGDAIRAYVVKARRDIPYPSGFASLVVERLFDLLTIAALAVAVLVGLLATGGGGELAAAVGEAGRAGRTALAVAVGVGALAVLSAAAIAGSARTGRRPLRRLADGLGRDAPVDRLRRVAGRFAGDIQRGAGSRDAFARIGAGSLLVWVLDVGTAVLVLSAFDVGVGPLPLLAAGTLAVSVGNLSKVLPLSPGGVGLYEAAFTLLVVALTPIAAPVAFAAAVLDHAVKNVVTVVGGGVAMVVLNVSLTTAVEEAEDPGPTTASG